MHGVIGIDEVGRGSWAGPLLVVAARMKNNMRLPDGVADSKALTKKRRSALAQLLKDVCVFGEGWVQPEEIDEHGLTKAMQIGVHRALIAIGAQIEDEIVIDGNINYCPKEFIKARCEVKADTSHLIVGAASIHAKVARDNHMMRAAQFYPYYGFEQHVGYGTAQHRSSLQIHGVSSIHRKSYIPVQAFL